MGAVRDETQSDRQLVERVIGGSKAAFADIVRPLAGRLIALAQRMLSSTSEAEEAVQDALASVWIARRRLDPDRPIAPFLTTTVLNKCRDRLRRRKAAGFLGIAVPLDDLSLRDHSPDPETLAMDRDTLTRLRLEMDRLPVRLREALVLVAVDGYSQTEAADLLGVTEKAVETRIYRARKQLQKKIDEF